VTARLILPGALRAQIECEARAAYPSECCGLVEGIRGGVALEITAVHPTANLSLESDTFEIDPAAHVALLRALRGTGRAVVGCYHSHPNGRAEPSERDRVRASEAGFVWLIAALGCESGCTVNAFVFDGNGFSPLTLFEAAEAV
jgi:proteasome lid subunit RPN8/RPN11